MRKVERKGFTLIELLVVISIIALLLAIMMPALGMVKEKAKFVVCRTNLKSIILGSKLYANDNASKMPSYNYNGLWINDISEYMEDVDEARYCASTKVKEERAEDVADQSYDFGDARTAWMWNWGTNEPEYGSYSINAWFYDYNEAQVEGFTPEQRAALWKNLGNVRQASNVPLFADSKWLDGRPMDTDYIPEDYDLGGRSTTAGGSMCRYIMDRHGKQTGVAFVDGHVDAVALSDMWTLKWNRTWRAKQDVKRGENWDGTPIYRKR
ncbi:PilD-dependent protein PddA [Anaerohalosphaera lusitana]|uniref:PilD-dependent protein PddA n=1 Tax=Anaerohalosphaera lusitana TaxID=1936003 RepID=A0A1U9NKW6_9BACT|nr:type II secretion system protein [Anaerohalosphaera lusitana]AQT68156.1 PilD-dependent protein PddA [Anaerohalosphaera lusitana]